MSGKDTITFKIIIVTNFKAVFLAPLTDFLTKGWQNRGGGGGVSVKRGVGVGVGVGAYFFFSKNAVLGWGLDPGRGPDPVFYWHADAVLRDSFRSLSNNDRDSYEHVT